MVNHQKKTLKQKIFKENVLQAILTSTLVKRNKHIKVKNFSSNQKENMKKASTMKVIPFAKLEMMVTEEDSNEFA